MSRRQKTIESPCLEELPPTNTSVHRKANASCVTGVRKTSLAPLRVETKKSCVIRIYKLDDYAS